VDETLDWRVQPARASPDKSRKAFRSASPKCKRLRSKLEPSGRFLWSSYFRSFETPYPRAVFLRWLRSRQCAALHPASGGGCLNVKLLWDLDRKGDVIGIEPLAVAVGRPRNCAR
jgi:hypothetical protein